MKPLRISLALLVAALFTYAAPAQTFHDCRAFTQNIHDTLDCVEAVFSEDPLHLTVSGMPPGNGIAVGAVLEQNTHYVSPFAGPTNISITPGSASLQPSDTSTSGIPTLGSLWRADARLSAIGSANGSWAAVGMLTLMPRGYNPSHRVDHNGVQVQCNKLGFLCTSKIFGLHLESSHRSLQTISFYGIGPRSGSTKYTFRQNDTYGSLYTFRQNDTYGSLRASLSIEAWLSVESGVELRQVDLPSVTAANSITGNFTSAAVPGLTVQPIFTHSYVALRTAPVFYASPRTDDQDENHIGTLMKPYLISSTCATPPSITGSPLRTLPPRPFSNSFSIPTRAFSSEP